MKIIPIAILVICSLAANAQTAKVIALTPEDAKRAQELHKQQEDLTKKMNDFNDEVVHKYLKADASDEGHTQTYSMETPKYPAMWIKQGWGFGAFEFSEDWKYIVPVHFSTPSSNLQFGGCYYSTPALSTITPTTNTGPWYK